MKRVSIFGMTVLFYFLFAGLVSAAGGDYREGYLLVRFNEQGVSAAANTTRQNVVNAAGGGTIQRLYSIVPGLALVQLPAGRTTQDAKIAFQSTVGVAYAEPDYTDYCPAAIPNDPMFGTLWGMNNTGQNGGLADADIDAPEAWDMAVGNQSVIVAVIDTGVDYAHPDLAANMWVNTAEQNGQAGVDDDGNGYIDDIYGYDFINGDGDPMDDNSHGTHCSGTIGGVGNNGIGVAGVCWNVKIMALKIFDGAGFTSSAAIIQAIQYAVQMRATLSSNSWGGGAYSQALYDAISAAGTANQLFVAAAGNYSIDNDATPFYPASYDLNNIISVMSTTRQDVRSSFSHWGLTSVDLAAPGSDIFSTVPVSMGSYGYKSGTSMACPHAAGACALVISAVPTLTSLEVKQILLTTVDKKNSLKNLSVSEGRLNVASALLAAMTDKLAPTPDPMEWKIEPRAVGLTTIYMEAVTATDRSGGVQYFFDCDVDAFDSGWQDSPVYYRGGYSPLAAYQFKVRARDAKNNVGQDSQEIESVLPSALPLPYPDPAAWKAAPRKLSTNRIGMEAAKGYGEAELVGGKWVSKPIEYRFTCTKSTDPDQDNYSKEDLTSAWSTNTVFSPLVSPVASPGAEYEFTLQMRQAANPAMVTDPSGTERTIGMAPPSVIREVPTALYRTIQGAIDAANIGDVVLVHPGVYREVNINFRGKSVTVKSENPEDPAIVAATVIDCAQTEPIYRREPRRAFLLQNGEGRNSVLAGFTIRNATTIDDPEDKDPTFYYGVPSRDNPSSNDGRDALGGAIYLGPLVSPTIRNCVFMNCSALGEYGDDGANGRNARAGEDGYPGDRGGHGGNAYGGAIYASVGSSPLIKKCQFIDCRAVGGNAGTSGNGSNGGGHPNEVDDANGHRGGDGGDAGMGGSAWGGAIYFEAGCVPELYNVTVRNCYIQVGEAGRGGNGGNGGEAKGIGRGGHGGNGGIGGDLRASNAYAGGIYFSDNTNNIIDGCVFQNCRVVAELSGNYSGGNGGNGGNAQGDNMPGGNGGHGGPAFLIPPKMTELGGVDATGGTGGNGGNGSNGGPDGLGGNGGFRQGAPGNGDGGLGADFRGNHTGIFPSNIYYMAYYWEDTANVDNWPDDPNQYLGSAEWPTWYMWESGDAEIIVTTPPAGATPGAAEYHYTLGIIFDSPFSPYYGFADYAVVYGGIIVMEDPNFPSDPNYYTYDFSNVDLENPVSMSIDNVRSLTPSTDQRDTGACAGANYYGENSIVVMTDTTISSNVSFANHGGGELYDKGVQATFDNCTFENNTTWYDMPGIENPPAGRNINTDYRFEGYGGALLADQPGSLTFNGCSFTANGAYSGGAIYCNFAPSDTNAQALQLTDCTFAGNMADYHFVYSYGGAVYAGNSFHPYEEYYFNYLRNYRHTNYADYETGFLGNSEAYYDFASFVIAMYDQSHGYIDFDNPITTNLWFDELEADHIINGLTPWYEIPVTNCTFVENVAPYGGSLCIDAANLDIVKSRFIENLGQVGAGGFTYAADVMIRDSVFDKNIGSGITSRGFLSEQDNGTVEVYCSGTGLNLSQSDIWLANNQFTANVTDGYGAALYINGAPLATYPQQLLNNLFVENEADVAGGAMVAEGGSSVAVTNCTFVDNDANSMTGGYAGAILAHDTFVDITNSIIWNNVAVLGSQIAVGDPYELVHPYDPLYIPFSTVFIDYSDVQGGQEDVYVSDGEWPWLWYGNNNIEDNPATLIDESDPLFVSISIANEAIERTFYLSQTASGQLGSNSPCVNSGIGLASGLSSQLAFEATTRTDHIADTGNVDMGYHYDAALPVKMYQLTASVYAADYYDYGSLEVSYLGGGFTVGQEPNSVTLKQGMKVMLTAVPIDSKLYRVKRWIGTDNDMSYDAVNYVTMDSDKVVKVEFELAVPRNLYVPESYDSIEDALLAARSGDRIILAPRPDVPYLITNPEGINFGNKDIVVTSIDPNNPTIVAQTIIDCRGSRYVSKRAFHFENGQTSKSVIQGITIRNAFTAVIGRTAAISTGRWPWWDGAVPPPWTLDPPNPSPLPPLRALSGEDGTGDSYGGAILCENGSSPTIRNCVFKNCTVSGGIGGDGENGLYPPNLITDLVLDSQSGGHSGKGTGNGYGGAIAVMTGSSPQILNCTFENNRATGGWGGIPGNAGRSYNNGRYGWGGNDYNGIAWASQYGINPEAGYGEGDGFGGAIYISQGCRPTISMCEFIGNSARPGFVYDGGNEGDGSAYPDPYDADPWARDGMRDGRPSYIISEGLSAGGAIFFEEEADCELVGCSFVQNQASNAYTYYDTPVGTRGGAIFSDPNATVSILPLRDPQNPDTIIRRSVFTGNLAGAIFCSEGSDLWIEGADFIQNASSLPVDLNTYLTPEFNVAGALTVDPNAADSSSIINCQFQDNISHVGGGAIRTLSDMNLTDCGFSGNQSQSDGGAIYSFVYLSSPDIHTTRMTIDNCEFSGNSSQGLGGGLFVKNVVLTMNDSFLVKNTAFSGGGLRVTYGDLTMQGCIVYGNEATGAIAGAHRTVTDEGFGGGLHIVDTPFSILNTRIENNIARGIIASGGGLCITGSQEHYRQIVKNCLFAENVSDNAGGGISALLYANTDFNYCTIANNTSKAGQGGAFYIDQSSAVTVENSIISGNKGIGIYTKTGGVIEDSHVLFNANQGGDVYLNGSYYSAPSIPGFVNPMVGDPLFVTDENSLGNYYLDQQDSPAINNAGDTAVNAGMNLYTTDLDDALDSGQADLGYHYPIETREYMLTTSVINTDGLPAEGTLLPASGMQPRGKIIPLNAQIGKEYFLVGWSGGTFSDTSQEITNTVLMSRKKEIQVVVRFRNTLNVGTSGDYDILSDAINAAQDGDIILVAPGEYTAASRFPTMTNTITLDGKKITISGSNPNDDTTVRATIFREIRFVIGNVNNQTIIEGITLAESRMLLLNADMILRNCVFTNCQFTGDYAFHAGTVPAGTDGYSQLPLTGGAVEMWDSSPRVYNCAFENNRAYGRYGENGFAGAQSHPTGGDGGWPGGAYGGAVYCGFSSEPDFIECTFTGNEAFGAEGGNGANGWVNQGVVYNGGRGGGWLYDEVIEAYLVTALNGGWDGWTNNAYGDKYSAYSVYSDYFGWYDFYGDYDLDVWKRWFSWGDDYTSWEQFEADYLSDPYDPLGDPYDQMMDVWRYSGYGGAVFCESDSNAKFTKCVFENNQSHGGRTGIGGYLVNGISPWPDRRLNMPTAGGAVFAANDCDLVFTDCQFRDNVADISTVDLPHTFQVSFGGAVAYQYGCTATFTNCDLLGNTATVGGSIYAFDTNSQIIDCNVFDNEAYIGAGVYSEDYNLTVKGTTFRSNQAITPAALPDPAESLDFTGMAGGLFAMVDTLNMRDSVFTGNTANISGGGLLLTGVVTSPSKVFNCLFADNLSGRDGAGASVNWSHQADFGNCTFANNAAQGLGLNAQSFGGNLAVNYDCKVSLIDSILWGGSATKGRQLAVTSGYVDDARPSILSVSYSDVQGGRTAVATHVEDGCQLEWISDTMITLDPLFVNAAAGDYHLSQIIASVPQSQTVNSPCLNAGSAESSALGLDRYTTATPVPQYDYGKVDLGYHYSFELSDDACRYADLKAAASGKFGANAFFDGIVDTGDLYILAAWWLTETCNASNLYCDGVDLTNSDGVDFIDFVYLSNCWQVEDTEVPSQVQWNQDPISGQGEFFARMSALEATDNWSYVLYKFENMTDPSHTSRWRQNYDKNLNTSEFEYVDLATSEPNVPWQWIDNGLSAQTYTYQIHVRDPRGNMTTTLLTKDVTVGLDYNPPLPNPALWAVDGQPVQNSANTIRMVAQIATDPEGNGVFYSFNCIENTALNSGWIASNEYITPAAVALVVNQTYTFRVKYRDNSSNQNETEFSTAIAVVVSDQLDFNPPLATAPLLSGVRLTVDSQSYHILTASDLGGGVIVDPEGNGEEFQFICDSTPALITNSVKVPWINVDNMLSGIRIFDVSWYPNGTPKVPYKIYIPVAGGQSQTYRVRVRDRSPAQNTTDWSEPIVVP